MAAATARSGHPRADIGRETFMPVIRNKGTPTFTGLCDVDCDS
jgi:hypothetical protein